jgi:cyclic-di-GMP phosphodiesterase, flagellum assembly factor TipF
MESGMVRFSATFAAMCMALIAVSLGGVAYLRFGFNGIESALIGLAVLMVLVAYNALAARQRDRADATEMVAGLTRTSGDMTRQLAEFGRRLNSMDNRVERAFERSGEGAQPLASELAELSSQVTGLAGAVAAHDAALGAAGGGDRREFNGGADLGPANDPVVAAAREVSGTQASRRVDAFSRLDQDGIIALVRDGIDAGRIDLYLQPVVTLPKRNVRYYEATSRLKAESGEVIAAGDFIKYAEAGFLMPRLDHMTVTRCVQVVRRLLLKNRDIGLFCNLSSATLTDSGFPQLLEFLEANRAIGPSLIFQFTQRAVRAMGPAEHESLAALAERGFRFSIDNVADLEDEGRELHERGFRFIKVPAALLLGRDAAPDLSGVFGGSGVDVVAERVESENIAADVLERGVRFGQGTLFAPPRPVRAEALQDGNGQEVKSAPRTESEQGGPDADPAGSTKSSADLLASAAAAAGDSLGASRNQVVRTGGRR